MAGALAARQDGSLAWSPPSPPQRAAAAAPPPRSVPAAVTGPIEQYRALLKVYTDRGHPPSVAEDLVIASPEGAALFQRRRRHMRTRVALGLTASRFMVFANMCDRGREKWRAS
jgi:hypothetical protein